MNSITFKSSQDLQKAVGVLVALNIPHSIAPVSSEPINLDEGDFKAIKASRRCPKPFKLREYPVCISSTTSAKAREIVPLLQEAFPPESSMKIVGEIMTAATIGVGVSITFTMRYGVRGNCPADIRSRVKRLLESIDTTATVTIGTPKNLMTSK